MIDEAWVNKVEASMFRTNRDTGANDNALSIWNLVRKELGMPPLTHRDLSQRHADLRGISIEEQLEDEKGLDEMRRERKRAGW